MVQPTLLLVNINRLITPSGRTKSGFLADQAELKSALFVAVTETWLNDGVFDSEVCHNFPGFSFFRSDRIGREGGGVALYLKDTLTGEVLGTFDNKVCQFLTVKIHQLDTVVTVFYRPPDTRMAEFTEALQKLDKILSDLPTPTPIMAVMGDFNFTRQTVTWSRGDEGHLVPIVSSHRDGETVGGKQDRLQAQRLVEFSVKHNLIQQVDVVTHGVETLDLVLSNDDDLVSEVTAEEYSQFTDHRLLTGSLSYKSLEEEEEQEEEYLLGVGKRFSKLDFYKAPWPEIQEELAKIDWESVKTASSDDPTLGLNIFNEKILEVLEKHVPERKKGKKKRRQMCRQRRSMWRRLSKIKKKIKSTENIHKLSKLVQER